MPRNALSASAGVVMRRAFCGAAGRARCRRHVISYHIRKRRRHLRAVVFGVVRVARRDRLAEKRRWPSCYPARCAPAAANAFEAHAYFVHMPAGPYRLDLLVFIVFFSFLMIVHGFSFSFVHLVLHTYVVGYLHLQDFTFVHLSFTSLLYIFFLIGRLTIVCTVFTVLGILMASFMYCMLLLLLFTCSLSTASFYTVFIVDAWLSITSSVSPLLYILLFM